MIEAVVSLLALCGLLMLGVPMVVGLITAVALDLWLTGAWASTLPQMMVSGMSRFVLLALPLFVLAGGVMNAGGISARLFEFARALVGPLRGGLAQVNVRDLDVLRRHDRLVDRGPRRHRLDRHPGDEEERAIPPTSPRRSRASSAGIGPMIPPSSPMILYSAVTGTSLGALFLAGLIPGILLGLSQMAIVAWLARKYGWQPDGRFSWAECLRTGLRAALSFGLPVIIVGGLVIGVFTPTEASAFAAVYAIFLVLLRLSRARAGASSTGCSSTPCS